MYFSRITLNPDQSAAAGLAAKLCNDAYHMHQVLWDLFDADPDANRDFLFRQESKEGWPCYYIVSSRKPNAMDGWKVKAKKYDPQLRDGDILAFKLRCNPVVKRLVGGKKRRCDVVMDEKKSINYQQIPKNKRPSMQQLVQQAGSRWLLERNEKYGFTVSEDAIRVDGYQQHIGYQKKMKITYSTLDFSGVLAVSNHEKLLNTLFSGIGPAKAFGCGLLLVRRA